MSSREESLEGQTIRDARVVKVLSRSRERKNEDMTDEGSSVVINQPVT
jgi:hypothetical protein